MSEIVAHWLSFAGEEGFLGAAIIEAEDFICAVMLAHRCGCNPGGEVKGQPLPQRALDAALALGYEPNRLYSKDEIDAIDRAAPWPGLAPPPAQREE